MPSEQHKLRLPRSTSPPSFSLGTPSRFLGIPTGYTPGAAHPGAAPYEHGALTPGLLFSTSRGNTPGRNHWWNQTSNGGAAAGASAGTGNAGDRASEVNPFEVTLSTHPSNSPSDVPQHDFLDPQAWTPGQGRRATVCGTANGGDLWSSLGGSAGIANGGYGALDSWIDFSGGHPPTPGINMAGMEAGGSAMKRRMSFSGIESGKRGVGNSQLDGLGSSPLKRLRTEDTNDPSASVLATFDPSAPFPARSFTNSTATASPHSSTNNSGPSSLTSQTPNEPTLTPPSSSNLLTGQCSHTSKHAPDLSQDVPMFVGIERYSEAVMGRAPEGAQDVVADFLSRMNQEQDAQQHQQLSQHQAPLHTQTASQPWNVPSTLPASIPSTVGSSVDALLQAGGGMMGSAPAPPPRYPTSVPSWTSFKEKGSGGTAKGKSKVSSYSASGNKARAPAALPVVEAASPSNSDRSSSNSGNPHLTEEEKRRQFLERNRVAACKSRAKKKEWQEALESRANDLAGQNADMQSLVSLMRDEIVSLRAMVAQHAACQCGALKGFVEQGGLGVPTGFGTWGLGAAAPLGAATQFVAKKMAEQQQLAAANAKAALKPKFDASTFSKLPPTPASHPHPSFLLDNAQNGFRGPGPIAIGLPVRPSSAPPTTPDLGLGGVGKGTEMKDYFEEKMGFKVETKQ